jgi:hypothetical protein
MLGRELIPDEERELVDRFSIGLPRINHMARR